MMLEKQVQGSFRHIFCSHWLYWFQDRCTGF